MFQFHFQENSIIIHKPHCCSMFTYTDFFAPSHLISFHSHRRVLRQSFGTECSISLIISDHDSETVPQFSENTSRVRSLITIIDFKNFGFQVNGSMIHFALTCYCYVCWSHEWKWMDAHLVTGNASED